MPEGIARICNDDTGAKTRFYVAMRVTHCTSSSFHQKHYEMKSMDFFARLGADPQSHCQCGKGMQRRMAEIDAISCSGFGETDY
jgi:hypothetical protein